MRVDDADGLETTLARIRQRYALHFNAPSGSREERNIDVALSSAARRRYPDAEIRYRKTYLAPRGSHSDGVTEAPVEVTQSPASSNDAPTVSRRRRAVNDVHDGPGIATQPAETTGDSSRAQPAGTESTQEAPAAAPKRGGWRRVDEQRESGPKRSEPAPKKDPPSN